MRKKDRLSILQALTGIILLIALSALSAQDLVFTPLRGPQTGIALEAYALKQSGKGIDEDYALRRHTDYEKLDEFDKRAKRDEYLTTIKKKLDEAAASIEATDFFVFEKSLILGEFDFGSNGFPIVELFPDRKREPGGSPEWSGHDSSFRIDAVKNYWPQKVFPMRDGDAFHRSRDGRFHFDWSPLYTNYTFSSAEEGKEFLNTYGRRPNVRFVTTLEDSEESEELRHFNFSVSCLIFIEKSGQRVVSRSIWPDSGSGEPCEAYFNQVLNNGTDFFGNAPVELGFGLEGIRYP